MHHFKKKTPNTAEEKPVELEKRFNQPNDGGHEVEVLDGSAEQLVDDVSGSIEDEHNEGRYPVHNRAVGLDSRYYEIDVAEETVEGEIEEEQSEYGDSAERSEDDGWFYSDDD